MIRLLLTRRPWLGLGDASRAGRYQTGMETPAPISAPTEPVQTGATWSRRTRWIVSLLLVWHVSAMIVGPGAVEPTSGLMTSIWEWYRPYLDVLYLNHGYHFFAPEPGPSHLIRYELVQADGSKRDGFFPHKLQHHPRLLYHRHFMLSEHLSQFAEPGVPPEFLKAYSKSYGDHLLAEHDAREVKLILVRHVFPRPKQVLDGLPLTDKSLYFERQLGTFRADGTAEYPKSAAPAESPAKIDQTVEQLPDSVPSRR